MLSGALTARAPRNVCAAADGAWPSHTVKVGIATDASRRTLTTSGGPKRTSRVFSQENICVPTRAPQNTEAKTRGRVEKVRDAGRQDSLMRSVVGTAWP